MSAIRSVEVTTESCAITESVPSNIASNIEPIIKIIYSARNEYALPDNVCQHLTWLLRTWDTKSHFAALSAPLLPVPSGDKFSGVFAEHLLCPTTNKSESALAET